MKYKHLFGPVPSRRLGISLGVDLVPFKTCTFNCVYCECGRTTALTAKRREFIPSGEVIKELEDFLSEKPKLDYVTFSGSGEPTLHTGLGRFINFVKEKYRNYRVAVMTNGSLLFLKSVRGELKNADVVVPSLDAATEKVFRRINRPHKSWSIKKVIRGLVDFRREYKGKIWLEVFIVPGSNDAPAELKKLKEVIVKIKPDKIQLNALSRPGAEKCVATASVRNLRKIAAFMRPLKAEIITPFVSSKSAGFFQSDVLNRIIATAKRRPVTAGDLSGVLGLHINEINKYVSTLLEQNRIKNKRHLGKVFFTSGES